MWERHLAAISKEKIKECSLSEMRDFFDRQVRTRILAFGALEVLGRLKFAENAACRKNNHFRKGNYQPPMRWRCK
jgi:hypothetical protein